MGIKFRYDAQTFWEKTVHLTAHLQTNFVVLLANFLLAHKLCRRWLRRWLSSFQSLQTCGSVELLFMVKRRHCSRRRHCAFFAVHLRGGGGVIIMHRMHCTIIGSSSVQWWQTEFYPWKNNMYSICWPDRIIWRLHEQSA